MSLPAHTISKNHTITYYANLMKVIISLCIF